MTLTMTDNAPERVTPLQQFELAWKQGNPPDVRPYASEYSTPGRDLLLELMVLNFLNWPHPDRSKYLQKFPQFKPELNRLFDLLKDLRPDKLRVWRGRLALCLIRQQQADSVQSGQRAEAV